MEADSDYFSHPRPELVAALPANPAARLLDLGCGSGAMSSLIRGEGKAGEIWGVEKDPASAARARAGGVFDRLLEGDLERIVDTLPPGHFDHVVAGDILEHLVDPWTVCAKLRACLVPGGTLVCSIPNIRNLGFVLGLLLGRRFAYRDSGVLDRTHLRFFARKDVHDLFAGAGFRDIRIGPVRPKKRLSWHIGRALLGDLSINGFLVTARNPAGASASAPG